MVERLAFSINSDSANLRTSMEVPHRGSIALGDDLGKHELAVLVTLGNLLVVLCTAHCVCHQEYADIAVFLGGDID